MRIWKKRVIKTPFFTNDISRPSRGRFLKFWMFWKADAFLRKMCMSDCCYNGFRVPHDWQMIVAMAKLMILRDCHVGTVVLWCGNDQTKLTTLSNQTAEGGTTQSWLQARGSPLEGLPSIWNPANALTFQIEDNSSWFSYKKSEHWTRFLKIPLTTHVVLSADLACPLGIRTTRIRSGGRSLWSDIAFSGDPYVADWLKCNADRLCYLFLRNH